MSEKVLSRSERLSIVGFDLKRTWNENAGLSPKPKCPLKKLSLNSQEVRQAGNGISRHHIQGSKIAKGLQNVKYSFTVPEKPKSWTELTHRRGLFEVLENFRKKSLTMPEKAERGTLLGFSVFCRKTSKKMKGDPLRAIKNFRKRSQLREKLKGGTLWFFIISIPSQDIKKY